MIGGLEWIYRVRMDRGLTVNAGESRPKFFAKNRAQGHCQGGRGQDEQGATNHLYATSTRVPDASHGVTYSRIIMYMLIPSSLG